MPPPKPATARAVAADILTRANPKKADVVHVLADFLKRTDETQRTTDFVFGVLKNRCLIDSVVEKVSTVPVERISHNILNILRVALYELIYCPQAADYAIVDEAVDYARRITNAKQAGFVNALLRQTLRHIVSRQKLLDEAQPRMTIPQTPGTGCEFDIDMLPDRNESPMEYLSCAFSLPPWLVESWLDEYGPEQTREICFASNRRPSIYLRPNILKITVEGACREAAKRRRAM